MKLSKLPFSSLAIAAVLAFAAVAPVSAQDTAPAAEPAPDTHLGITQEILKELLAITEAADSAKDAASAEAAKKKLEASAAKLKAIVPRMNKLGPPKDDATKKSLESEGEKLFATLMKLDEQEKRLKGDPALKPALDGFTGVQKAMEEVMSAGN